MEQLQSQMDDQFKDSLRQLQDSEDDILRLRDMLQEKTKELETVLSE